MNQYMPEGVASSDIARDFSGRDGLMRAMACGAILEGVAVMCDHRYNLHIELGGGIRGIIPREESQYPTGGEGIKDIAILTRVGKRVCFKVKELTTQKSGETLAVLSRRAAQEECRRKYLSTLTPGDIIPARVTHLESFGAFLDVGCGIPSLLAVDCISVSRISHPSERLSVGDCISVVVKGFDERGRMSVSQKELLGSWEENAALFSEGETVRGIIRSVESYGVFVELTPNLAGLAEWRDDVYPGQLAAVYIKSIIPEKMKVKLVIIDLADEEYYRGSREYFIDTDEVRHIDSWQYSPVCCKRRIETIFI